jgi:hypothetical protein
VVGSCGEVGNAFGGVVGLEELILEFGAVVGDKMIDFFF